MTASPIVKEIAENSFRIQPGVVEGSKIYSVFCFFNQLCVIDVLSGEVNALFSDPEASLFQQDLHLVSAKIKDWLVLLPHRSSDLILFDLSTKQSVRYRCGGDYLYHYNTAFLYGNKIFLLPVFRPDIGVFDMLGRTLTFCKIPLDEPGVVFDQTMRFAVTSNCTAGNRVFLLCSNPNLVIEFDCDQYTFRFHTDLSDCMSMCYDGSDFWVSRKDKTIFRTDFKNPVRFLDRNLPAGFQSSEILPLSGSIYVNGKILFLSYNANMILRVDSDSGEIDSLRLPEAENADFLDSLVRGCTMLGSDDTYLYLFSRRQTAIIRSDVAANTYEVIPLRLDQAEMSWLAGWETFPVETDCNLRYFIQHSPCPSRNFHRSVHVVRDDHENHIPESTGIISSDHNMSAGTEEEKSNGQRIYEYLKSGSI